VALDRSDFNHQVQQQQFGLQPGFWPIILNFATGAPGGTPMQVGQEYEININPCDHIWLPTIYDASIGLNPGQQTPQPTVSGITMIVTGLYGAMNNFFGNSSFSGIDPTIPGNPGALWGMNAVDLWDSSQEGTSGPECIQTATIFSLRFNSQASPWFIWSLSDFLAGGGTFLDQVFHQNGSPVGQGDCMRSISGPISRLWVKLLAPATVQMTAFLPVSQVVLLSSLGYRQQTSGAKQLSWSGNETDVGTLAADGATQSQYSVEGGGYVQTNLSTLERIALEQAGQGNTRPPDGRR
jgi:hypothetical protein